MDNVFTPKAVTAPNETHTIQVFANINLSVSYVISWVTRLKPVPKAIHLIFLQIVLHPLKARIQNG